MRFGVCENKEQSTEWWWRWCCEDVTIWENLPHLWGRDTDNRTGQDHMLVPNWIRYIRIRHAALQLEFESNPTLVEPGERKSERESVEQWKNQRTSMTWKLRWSIEENETRTISGVQEGGMRSCPVRYQSKIASKAFPFRSMKYSPTRFFELEYENVTRICSVWFLKSWFSALRSNR